MLTLTLLRDNIQFKYTLNIQLLHVFNFSIKRGIFPNQLKFVRVISIFKRGNKWDIDNYRAISVLPCFSKMLWKILYNHVCKHLNENNLL